ncbi:hypothetical protein EC912_105141 [Luteibacter rhizovicinus]|uniref:Lipoprotein n=1 Tax=Luteibacter rhizovicinus TaxID=242606 RepID=A0A4R3YM08_9GAMM|nr:hypothetical protein [Luteibacter rhizovicinus]TCV93281.1 hypothetical protein EC912_105141 [Luteibacter rhizovicinus]
MKHVLAIAACVALAGCATRGMTDTLPKLSSHTSKSVQAYVQCVEPKWQAITPNAKGNSKDDEGRITADDSKSSAHERIDVKASGAGAQVVMYEIQKGKGDYDGRYREEAISCL